MLNIYKQLATIAKEKSTLLKKEHDLWEKLAQILSDAALTNTTIESRNNATNFPSVDLNFEKAIMKLSEVKQYTNISSSQIYKLISEGKFPAQIKLGQRSSGWLFKDINQWINERSKNNY